MFLVGFRTVLKVRTSILSYSFVADVGATTRWWWRDIEVSRRMVDHAVLVLDPSCLHGYLNYQLSWFSLFNVHYSLCIVVCWQPTRKLFSVTKGLLHDNNMQVILSRFVTYLLMYQSTFSNITYTVWRPFILPQCVQRPHLIVYNCLLRHSHSNE